MTEQIDVEALKERLRGAVQKLRRTPMPIGDVAPMLTNAADALAQLQAENAALKLDVATFKHGYRIASDNCVRLETMLADERAKLQAIDAQKSDTSASRSTCRTAPLPG